MYIEDYLEILADPASNIILDNADVKLIKSLASQTKKNVPFTDRQYNLAKLKIISYKEQLDEVGYKFTDNDLNNLRLPLRIIDRSKTISLVEREYIDLFGNVKTTMIAIRFPYSNKMIKYIEFIKLLQKNKKLYDTKTKTHFIELTENNIYKIVEKFKQANFEIDKNVELLYNTIKYFIDNEQKYKPGIYNFELKNTHEKLLDYAYSLLGKPTKNNYTLYWDRRNTLGLKYFDSDVLYESLKLFSPTAQKISNSNKKEIFCSKKIFPIEDICTSLLELKRWPILVILKNNNELEYLQKIHSAFSNNILQNEMSVLFRLANANDYQISFNTLVQELKLNNPVNDKTKLVFLNNIKIPKPLLSEKFNFNTTILLESFRHQKILTTYYNQSDLIIHYDEILTTWKSQQIEQL